MKTPKAFILSSRELIASPSYAAAFELEELFVSLCQAELLCPVAKVAQKYSMLNKGFSTKIARGLGKITGSFHTLEDIKIRPENFNILIMIDVTASYLKKIEAIPNWRQKFDVVAAYVWDAWLIDSFPRCASQFDHLFIPYVEFQPAVEKSLKVPVTVLPLAYDVLSYGTGNRPRFIDVASYGRIPKNYRLELAQKLNHKDSNLFYYHQVPESAQKLPNMTYCSSRFDYLHRLQFRKILQKSKLILAFDFNYTSVMPSLEPSMTLHPSHKCNQSVLTHRWFEIAGAGSVVVGKKPQSRMVDDYFGWKDSTIELPDDSTQGVEFIKELLNDTKRLTMISQRNYVKSLEINDWRRRISSIFNVLGVPAPEKLKQSIKQLQERSHHSSKLLS